MVAERLTYFLKAVCRSLSVRCAPREPRKNCCAVVVARVAGRTPRRPPAARHKSNERMAPSMEAEN